MTVVPPANQNYQTYYSIENIAELTEWVELDSMLATLPIGIIDGDNNFVVNTEYKTKILTGHLEIELGDLEDRYGRDNQLRILQYFIPMIIDTIDNSPLADFVARPTDFVAEMFMADAIAITIGVRIAGQHWGVPISCTCPCDRAVKIKPTSPEDYHDLRGLKFKVWRGQTPPLFEYKLECPLPNGRTSIILSPPKLSHVFDSGFRESQLAIESKLSILLGDLDEEEYELLQARDRHSLKQAAKAVNEIGMETAIEMFCPECDDIWESPLILGSNHPDFILSLLGAPRSKEGTTRDYLFEIAKFLLFGEQAPFKSATEVLNLTPKIRNDMVTSLSESYERQAKKMKS